MKIVNIGLAIVLLILAGCAATPPAMEITLPSQSLADVGGNGESRSLVIFNDSNTLTHGRTTTGAMNIYLDGKGVTQLNIDEYVIVSVSEGKHVIELLHKDTFDFRSSHEVEIKEQATFLKVFATFASNGAEVVKRPEGFDNEYQPAVVPSGL